MSDFAETGDHSPGGTELYIGLMSGTSMDGIDAALVSFGSHQCHVHASCSLPYPNELRTKLLLHSRNASLCNVDELGAMDQWIGECFRDAVLELLQNASVPSAAVKAIGSHGQTIRHQPRAERPFTLQLGDPNIIAVGTGITTVADFRRADIALGGEGAPLAPAFHQWFFANKDGARAVVNIGGIANVTILHEDLQQVAGFDTGPGNTLLDSWIRAERNQSFDESGNWARSGRVSDELLSRFLEDPFFDEAPPKSTGFEKFNADWLAHALSLADASELEAADVQATLAELSAATIGVAVTRFAPDFSELIVCGGGVHNVDLMDRLQRQIPDVAVVSIQKYGLDPDAVEATAFAWLAYRRLAGLPGNLPSVTGASRAACLGAVYPCAD